MVEIIDWISRLQRSVTLSSCEAESVTMSIGVQNLLWIKKIYLGIKGEEIENNSKVPCTLFGDNQSSLCMSKNPDNHGRSKHIAVRDLFVREKFSEGVVDVAYVESKLNCAEILTKPLPTDHFVNRRNNMGMRFLRAYEEITRKRDPEDNYTHRKRQKTHIRHCDFADLEGVLQLKIETTERFGPISINYCAIHCTTSWLLNYMRIT